MRDNWRKECCRDLMVPCADMNTDILYRILFSTSDCITVCHIWLPVIRKNKWLRFQTVCRYIPLSLKNHNRLVIFVCQRIEWRYIFSTNTGHPLKNTCEMTGTDFSTDGLMRRYVTGGNNQWHTVASLHMTIMMNRIGTVADRQPKARKVNHGEMTWVPAKDTIKLAKKVIQFTDAGEVTGNFSGILLQVIIRLGVKAVTRIWMRTHHVQENYLRRGCIRQRTFCFL